jgi:carbonic anhydrase
MNNPFKKLITGYQQFREKYATGDQSIMQQLAYHGQNPDIMIVACSDSRVDPCVILQSDPGELFIVRNVANIVPPYEKDNKHHGVSAALEFGINHLNVSHLIILGHSQCGGIKALIEHQTTDTSDFIHNWVSIINKDRFTSNDVDECARQALHQSYNDCLAFPWIQEKVAANELSIHRCFFDIKHGLVSMYSEESKKYETLPTP